VRQRIHNDNWRRGIDGCTSSWRGYCGAGANHSAYRHA
jgi:hypothetical protein